MRFQKYSRIKNLIISIYNKYKENSMSCIKYAKYKNVNIGNNCRILTKRFSSEPYIITIGNNTTISLDVEFITHDGAVEVLRNLYPEYKNIDIIKPIKIGNNCFIGARSIILPGTTLGDNTIVAAGCIVTKSFPSNVVIGGVPGKILSTIEEYLEKNKYDFIYTKKMQREEKKRFLKSVFKIYE